MTTRRPALGAVAIALALALACGPGDPPAAGSPAASAARGDTLVLDPGGRGSAITAATTEADLVQRFGAANVRGGEIDIAEGDVGEGATVFPDDSTRRMEV